MRSKNQGQDKPGLNGTVEGNEGFSLISNEKLIALYRGLLKCRMAGQGKNGSYAPVRGGEAGTVGVAIDLGVDDVLISPHHGWMSGFGDDGAIVALLRAANHDGTLPARNGLAGRIKLKLPATNGNGTSAAATRPTHAAIGAALANKTRKNGRVAVILGRGEDAESWDEALMVASIHALPMIFLNHENGNRAVRKSRLAKINGAAQPETPWFPSITVDSHDVVAVYRVANEAIARARQGRGPTLIECEPFRVNGNGRHSHDAVVNMERYLRGKGLFQPRLKGEILKEVSRL